MVAICSENGPGNVIHVEINGERGLSEDLVLALNKVISEVENSVSSSALMIEVIGGGSPEACGRWPGSVQIRTVSKWEGLLRRLECFEWPVIVLAQRVCSQVALELLLVADLRLAYHDFIAIGVPKGGHIWPGMVIYRLCRQLGESNARRLLLDTSPITAVRMLDLGIMDELLPRTTGVPYRVKSFLAHAPIGDLSTSRRLIQESLAITFEDALGGHLAACDRALRNASIKAN